MVVGVRRRRVRRLAEVRRCSKVVLLGRRGVTLRLFAPTVALLASVGGQGGRYPACRRSLLYVRPVLHPGREPKSARWWEKEQAQLDIFRFCPLEREVIFRRGDRPGKRRVASLHYRQIVTLSYSHPLCSHSQLGLLQRAAVRGGFARESRVIRPYVCCGMVQIPELSLDISASILVDEVLCEAVGRRRMGKVSFDDPKGGRLTEMGEENSLFLK